MHDVFCAMTRFDATTKHAVIRTMTNEEEGGFRQPSSMTFILPSLHEGRKDCKEKRGLMQPPGMMLFGAWPRKPDAWQTSFVAIHERI